VEIFIKSHDVLLSPFIKKHLNEQALVELKKLWQEGVKPIPEDASAEEKYEIAYGNLMRQGKSNLKFIVSLLMKLKAADL